MKSTQIISPRTRRKHQATMQDILDTARAIMRQEGVAALSMHELARRMEMRAPSLYNYFSGKMDIYDALFRFGFSLFDEYLMERLKYSTGLRDDLRIFMEGYLSFAHENPELFQLCFERPVPGFTPSQQSLDVSLGILNRFYGRLEGLRNNLQTDLNSKQIVNLVIAVAHGLTSLHVANEPQTPVDQARFGSLIPAAVSMLERTLALKG